MSCHICYKGNAFVLCYPNFSPEINLNRLILSPLQCFSVATSTQIADETKIKFYLCKASKLLNTNNLVKLNSK